MRHKIEVDRAIGFVIITGIKKTEPRKHERYEKHEK